MKILVTGDSGFIARFLIPLLAKNGHEVRGIDLVANDHKLFEYPQVRGDILDESAVLDAVDDVDCVIHLAAEHKDEGPTKDDYFRVNEKGTETLLRMAGKQRVNRFMFFSTVAVYGNHCPADEETCPDPSNDYGRSKLAGEKKVLKWVDADSDRRAIIVRPTAVYGPHNRANIYRLIDRVYHGKFVMVGRGDHVKSIAFVRNVVAATEFLLGTFDRSVNVYNLSDYPQMTIQELVDLVAAYSPRGAPSARMPLWLARLGVSVAEKGSELLGMRPSLSKARLTKFSTSSHFKSGKIRKLGFEQPFTTENGLLETINWNVARDWTQVAVRGQE